MRILIADRPRQQRSRHWLLGYTSFGGHISDPDSSLRLEIDTSRTMGMKHLKPGEGAWLSRRRM